MSPEYAVVLGLLVGWFLGRTSRGEPLIKVEVLGGDTLHAGGDIQRRDDE